MQLPDILAGPILRRTDSKELYCWIALSKPFEARTEVFTVQQSNGAFFVECISSQSETTIVRMGENLFLYLMKTEPNEDSFPTGQLLGYNVFFSDGDKEWHLGDYQLLDPHNPYSIVYDDFPLPSFFIPANQHASFMYGSCQKLHGTGNDAMIKGDNLIAGCWFDLHKRPASLFLLGDQIYADDVAEPITPLIQNLGETLIGNKEPLHYLTEELAPTNGKNIYHVNARSEIMKKLCGFTSRKAANHLIALGEYSAMYLLSWSPSLWQAAGQSEAIPKFDELLSNNNYYVESDKAMEENRKEYEEQSKALIQFAASTPHIRRVMANMSVYMIFDDHDITDDWNISYDWMENVWSAPLGRHVIANGLTAYWAFQGWGNAPESFSTHFLAVINSRLKERNYETKQYENWISTMWSFSNWHYTIPSTPTTIVLDTRTQRFYPDTKQRLITPFLNNRTNGPNLIRKDGWDQLETSLYASGWHEGEPLILLSATPLYGVDLIETFLKKVVLPISNNIPKLQEAMDLEWWKFNGQGFHEFHTRIASWNPSECVILSGDAHMAFALATEVEFYPFEKRMIHQYTSSPIKNESFRGLANLALKGSIFLGNQVIKRNITHRYYDHSQLLCEGIPKTDCIWKETIRHETLDNGFLIKTTNNIGLIEFTGSEINNKFI